MGNQGADGFGPGMGFQVGHGFDQHTSVFVRGSVGKTDVQGQSSGVTHVDLGLRYSFGGTSRALRPFALAALNGRLASDDVIGLGNAYARGIGFTGGGGLEYFVSPTVAIDAALLYSVGVSNQVRTNRSWEQTSLDANSRRIEIGISLHQ